MEKLRNKVKKAISKVTNEGLQEKMVDYYRSVVLSDLSDEYKKVN